MTAVALDESVRELEWAEPMADSTDEIARRLSAIEVWVARHDGTCTERHESQKEMLDRMGGRIHDNTNRVSKLETRIAYIAGAAAALGGGIGGGIAAFFGG